MHARSAGPIEMHLPEYRGCIAGLLKLFGDGRLVFGERSGQPRHSRRRRQLTCEETLTRWRADRRIAEVPREPDALSRERVEMRRAREPIPVRAENVPGMVVGENENEIRLPSLPTH